MKFLLTVGVVALAASYASAECNNMCSGHGFCGANDACTCYRNWMGNDCSERVCQFGVAFVDTAQGDLNHDGSVSVLAANAQVTTMGSPSGTFELYPAFATNNEAHAYMECSNKGLCDRASGECVCFDGYEGSACQRTVCPNSCSGHGVCRNINDRTQALSGSAATSYQLWDGLKNQACVCDPGYSGTDCHERLCPRGADPLYDESAVDTAVVSEVQHIDASGTGTFTLKYTDTFGETWETSHIDPVDYVDADTVNTAVANALKAIPNSVIEDVTAGAVTDSAVSSGNGQIYKITFTHNAGDLNMLTLGATSGSVAVTITEDTKGTKDLSECSGRGLCDYETGICKCFRGYRLDDCSSQHALSFSNGAL